MARSIKDSLQLLNETLTNCKTALTEKGVTDLETIKISDVDEKIGEIETSGNIGEDEFSCTFNKIEFYTNIDDPIPWSKTIDQTVKSAYGFWFGNVGDVETTRKMVFDMSVKNVGSKNNYTGNLYKGYITIYRSDSNAEIEVSGKIENGSGDIVVTCITSGEFDMYDQVYSADPLILFPFGAISDGGYNPVMIYISVNNN